VMQAMLDPSGVSSANGGVGRGPAWKAAWDDLIAALGAYHTNKDEALKDLILGLVSAISGTPIDVDKPPVIPDWPLPPKLHGVNGAQVLPRVRTHRRLLRARSALPTLCAPSPRLRPAPVQVAQAVRSVVPPSPGWNGVDALLAAVQTTTSDLSEAQKIAANLDVQLRAFDVARDLPASMRDQLDDLAGIFTFTASLITFVEPYAHLDAVLKPVAAAMADQAKVASSLPAVAQGIVAAAAPIDASVNDVISSVPTEAVMYDVLDAYDGWATGALALVQLVDLGDHLDTDGTQAAAILSVKGKVDDRAAQLATRVSHIGGLAQQALQLAAAISADLVSLGGAYQQLADHSAVVSDKALPTLDLVARDLGLANGIFDPLSCLLVATGCVDAQNPTKAAAGQLALGFDRATSASLAPLGKALETGLDNLLEGALPLGAMRTALAKVRTDLTTTQPALSQRCTQLVALLAQLRVQLAPVLSYEADRDGKSVTIHDNFLDRPLADQMAGIIQALAPQG